MISVCCVRISTVVPGTLEKYDVRAAVSLRTVARKSLTFGPTSTGTVHGTLLNGRPLFSQYNVLLRALVGHCST